MFFGCSRGHCRLTCVSYLQSAERHGSEAKFAVNGQQQAVARPGPGEQKSEMTLQAGAGALLCLRGARSGGLERMGTAGHAVTVSRHSKTGRRG
jgi:hypothetical protein